MDLWGELRKFEKHVILPVAHTVREPFHQLEKHAIRPVAHAITGKKRETVTVRVVNSQTETIATLQVDVPENSTLSTAAEVPSCTSPQDHHLVPCENVVTVFPQVNVRPQPMVNCVLNVEGSSLMINDWNHVI
ncbi:hypothetical protein FDP41_007942 [Naegleria fowleri]|uniref:Uncharacterized protein n=1 Tax=Naegleria fowleri TaxID=5763 RepID=A0A6A5C3T8_NAEFO|nr:uncharacterized protein FDP41_007942 [Naegleria fowleri]KAF0984027.1 hypothetical protein FDP41_007942 [Naegleria fowleri]